MIDRPYVPEACVWELTLQCNMRCIHCGSAAGARRENELAVDECLRVADELLTLGCRRATLIGGEVFLYRGWQRVARHLADGGAAINVITNGYLMGDAQLEQIQQARLQNVGLSLDGMEQNHNRTRNVHNSFERVLAAMERLRAEGVSIAVVTSLLAYSFDDLEPMHALLADQGVAVWQIQIATPMGNMARQQGLLLDPAKTPLLTDFIRRKRDERGPRVYAGDDVGYFDPNEMYLRNRPGVLTVWRGCQAGLSVVGIDSVGNVRGCESLCADEFIEGNVRQQPLADIWHDEGNFAYNRRFDVGQLTGRCAGCAKGTLCRGGCRGSSYFTTGSLYENLYCCYPGQPG